LWDDAVELCCVLRDVRQGKLILELREPHGWLYGPERRDTNTDTVDSESLIRRLLRPCWCISVLLQAAFEGGILHLFTALRGLLSAVLPVWYHMYKLPGTHTCTILCAHNTIHPRTYNHCLLFVSTLQFSLALASVVLLALHKYNTRPRYTQILYI